MTERNTLTVRSDSDGDRSAHRPLLSYRRSCEMTSAYSNRACRASFDCHSPRAFYRHRCPNLQHAQ